MLYTGLYAVLLVLHLLTVAFLVGPAAVSAVLSSRHIRQGRAEALRDGARTTRGYTLASVATVLLGSALVSVSGGDSGTAQWSHGQAWVVASYALWLLAVVLVLVVVVPAQEAAAGALERGQDATSYAPRIGAAAGIAMLSWAAIIALMVTKPGA